MPDKTDNGNGRVANALQDERIGRMADDITEIKTDLKEFISATVDTRLHCSNEFGSINTSINWLRGLVTVIIACLITVVTKVIFFLPK